MLDVCVRNCHPLLHTMLANSLLWQDMIKLVLDNSLTRIDDEVCGCVGVGVGVHTHSREGTVIIGRACSVSCHLAQIAMPCGMDLRHRHFCLHFQVRHDFSCCTWVTELPNNFPLTTCLARSVTRFWQWWRTMRTACTTSLPTRRPMIH